MTEKGFQRGLKTLKPIFSKGALPPLSPPTGALLLDPSRGLSDSQPELMKLKSELARASMTTSDVNNQWRSNFQQQII